MRILLNIVFALLTFVLVYASTDVFNSIHAVNVLANTEKQLADILWKSNETKKMPKALSDFVKS